MNSSQIPIARKEGLVIQEASGEVLVYDLDKDKAFSLNPTAAEVWRACDGNSSVAEIASNLSGSRDQEEKEKVVWLALDQLKEKNLIANEITSRFEGVNRREVIKKVGLATAIALPVIAMLSFPSSTLAAACPVSLCGGLGVSGGCGPGERCCPSTVIPGTFQCVSAFGLDCGAIPGTTACP
ncbi:MAG: PqqD family protein [Acidobacteria bacterium]|nr:MAG: PqqD family protein [Acidobacteriota bacterium]REK01440.1 MAG: PqqD family protein [Acidobacteriota bacterium]REK14396.1 MAG: PqqD family protein [Acidobacteriota bacterium]REK45111.1 MAG: PqqD family protein [Acidobacteriota bacterium]